MNYHIISDLRRNKIDCDIFERRSEKYLLVVDYFFKFVEAAILNNNTTNKNVINSIKIQFFTQGIPLTLMSDGQPKFRFTKFKKFI